MSTLLALMLAVKLVPEFSTPASSVVVPASKTRTSLLVWIPVSVSVVRTLTVVVLPAEFRTVGADPPKTLIVTAPPEEL